jgi:hypothetical protein
MKVTHQQLVVREIPCLMGKIIQQSGFMSLWRGNGANMLRAAPYSGVQFAVFDMFQRFIARLNN